MPIEETLGALDELVRAGKVREIGNSNFTGRMIDDAADVSEAKGWAQFRTAQNHMNLLERSPLRRVLPACEAHGLAFLPYFPLASGLLTGKYQRGEAPPEGTRLALWGGRAERILSDDNFALVDDLTAFAAERDHTILELAFAWLAAQPAMGPIIAGATSPAQIQANAAAVDWKLGAEDLAAIDAILAAHTPAE